MSMITNVTQLKCVTTLIVPNQLSTVLVPTIPQTLTLINTGLVGPEGDIGPTGPAGASDGYYDLDFSYGDATPVLLATVVVGTRVQLAAIDIYTPFNGAGASLSIGTLAVPGQYMLTTENDPAMAHSYETSPMWLTVSAQIYLFITPGAGATAGSGNVRIQAQP